MDDALSLSPTGKAIRAPRAAAVAGIAFALLLGTVIVIIQIAVPDDPDDAAWVEDDTRRGLVLFALNLLPFAGIAFLWFIGVIRDRLGEGEDRFFATVFLGSGLLFVAMLFATGAVVGSLVVAADEADGALTEDLWSFGRGSGLTLFSVYAMRMAGVFTVSTVSLLMRLKIVPPWLAGLGFVTAAILLLGSGRFAWVGLVFPGWILILSTYLLLTMMRSSEAGNRVASDPPAQL
jgi:hypothetical protein